MANTQSPLEILVGIVADTESSKAGLQAQLRKLSQELQGLELGVKIDDSGLKGLGETASTTYKNVASEGSKAAKKIAAEFSNMEQKATHAISDIAKEFKGKGKDFTIKTDFDIQDGVRSLKGLQVDVKQTEDIIERISYGVKTLDSGEMSLVQTSVKNINAETYNLSKNLNDVNSKLRILHQEGKISSDTFDEMSQRASVLTNSSGFKELGNDIKLAVSEQKILTDSLKEQEAVEKKLQDARQKTLNQLEKMSQAGRIDYSQAGAFSDAANSTKSIEDMDKLRHSIALAAQEYSQVTKAASSASTSFTNLNHRIEDLTISTKLSAREAEIWRSKYNSTTSAQGIKEINRELTVHLNKQKQINADLKAQEANQKKINNLINQMTAAQNKNPKAFSMNAEFDSLLSQVKQIDPASKGAAKSIDGVSTSFGRMKAEATAAGRESMTLMDSFRVAMEKFPVWMAASTAFYGTVRSMRDAISQIIDMDSQMTVLRRVAGDGVDVNKVLEESVALAGKLGNEIADINEGFIAFARQGFRGEELTKMAEYATLLGNISELNVEDAASVLTAGLKGFNIEAENAIGIVDSLNEVDNNYSITTLQLAEAMQRSAGAASTYGKQSAA